MDVPLALCLGQTWTIPDVDSEDGISRPHSFVPPDKDDLNFIARSKLAKNSVTYFMYVPLESDGNTGQCMRKLLNMLSHAALSSR